MCGCGAKYTGKRRDRLTLSKFFLLSEVAQYVQIGKVRGRATGIEVLAPKYLFSFPDSKFIY